MKYMLQVTKETLVVPLVQATESMGETQHMTTTSMYTIHTDQLQPAMVNPPNAPPHLEPHQPDRIGPTDQPVEGLGPAPRTEKWSEVRDQLVWTWLEDSGPKASEETHF